MLALSSMRLIYSACQYDAAQIIAEQHGELSFALASIFIAAYKVKSFSIKNTNFVIEIVEIIALIEVD